jgi:hypothetical protein
MKFKTLKFRINKNEIVRNETFNINASRIVNIDFYHNFQPEGLNAGTLSIEIDKKNVIENSIVFNNRSFFRNSEMKPVIDPVSNNKEIKASLIINQTDNLYNSLPNYFNVFIIVGYV